MLLSMEYSVCDDRWYEFQNLLDNFVKRADSCIDKAAYPDQIAESPHSSCWLGSLRVTTFMASEHIASQSLDHVTAAGILWYC